MLVSVVGKTSKFLGNVSSFDFGQTHSKKFLEQPEQTGKASSHFFFLLLHGKQPVLVLLVDDLFFFPELSPVGQDVLSGRVKKDDLVSTTLEFKVEFGFKSTEFKSLSSFIVSFFFVLVLDFGFGFGFDFCAVNFSVCLGLVFVF
ncbi:unnamed protein product [[Candida] boidinii]|nr:unnamed protein product [[Candida] boidinii]